MLAVIRYLLTARGRPMIDKIRGFEALSKIPNLNHGGCGFAAVALWHRIKKDYPRSRPKIVLISWFEEMKTPRSCSHIVVQFGRKLYDSDGEYSRKGGYRLVLDRPDPLLPVLKEENEWNSAFDRKHVKDIAHALELEPKIFEL